MIKLRHLTLLPFSFNILMLTYNGVLVFLFGVIMARYSSSGARVAKRQKNKEKAQINNIRH